MRLSNCSIDQDAILTACESFGGKAAEAAAIAKELDSKLDEALEKIQELEQEIREMS